MNCSDDQNCDAIVLSIQAQYDCTFDKSNPSISCFYMNDHTDPGQYGVYCDSVHYGRSYFVAMTFTLKTDLSPEDVKVEASKFTITQPSKSWKDGPYEVIIPITETVDAYYIWARYESLLSDVGACFTRRKYTPGNKIVGEPEVRKETMTKPFTGKAGSTIMFKILRSDLVGHPLNILHLERFLAKYCPLKPEKAKEQMKE